MSTRVRDLKGQHFDPNIVPRCTYGVLEGRIGARQGRRYQRVLLLSPPATLFRGDLPRCTYPLGLGYLAAVLEINDYDVRILDCLAEGYAQETTLEDAPEFVTYGLTMDQIAAEVAAFEPDVVGVSSIFSNQADVVAAMFQIARRVCPNAKLTTGGAHARYFAANYIEDIGLDAVFLGEAESSFLQYMEALNGRGEFSDITNAVVRDNGQVHASSTLVLIKRKQRDSEGHWAEIDDIPYPAWHLYNMEKYFSIGAYQSPYTIGDRVGQIYTSRGCTAKCTFCTTTNFWGGKLRRRSPANVVGELEILKHSYAINEFHIQDDNITNDKAHAKDLFRHLRAVNLPWCTPQGTALWRMDEELLDLMAASGCYQVTFAVESGVQRVLTDLIRKPLDLDKTKHLISYARRIGISTHGFFIIGMPPMYGHPGESIEEMTRTLAFAQDSGFDSASFFTATPIIGSALLTECVRQGLIEESTPLYRMSYKQGLISVPGLWNGTEIAELAATFNRDFNSGKTRRNARREWSSTQY
jgi:radical SAM superfamily enzyme YgiQ (UPF0313 family)